MSKEDRYAHLDDELDEEETHEQVADTDESTSEVHVTIDDGNEETILTIDSEDVSVADLRDAIQTVSNDTHTSPTLLSLGVRSVLSAQRIALSAAYLGPAVALNQAALLTCMDTTE